MRVELKVRAFMARRFGKHILSRARHQSVVKYRRLIVLFLVNDVGMRKIHVARVLQIDNASVHWLLKPVIDKEFEAFQRKIIEDLKADFENFCKEYHLKIER